MSKSGKGEYLAPPPHTTGHAGPHPAVRKTLSGCFGIVYFAPLLFKADESLLFKPCVAQSHVGGKGAR